MAAELLRWRAKWVLSALLAGILLAFTLPAASQVIDPGTAVEACIGCHGPNTPVPVSDVNNSADAHYVDLHPSGPATPSSYRQLNVALSSVDVTGTRVVIDFTVTDENGLGVTNLFDSDGRFSMARLALGAEFGDPTEWLSVVFSERFTTVGGDFQNLGGGNYRYLSEYDPTTEPIATADTMRVAVQISAGDIPAGNGWCDFDASLSAANDCTSSVTLTRDIVQTANCNSCHGVTSDTKLSFHGGGRTEVEYCVTCHNPGIGETDFTNLVHKIHYGNGLTQGFRSYSDVGFTRDIDNCVSCHGGGGLDSDNWKTVPNFTACQSCHDDIDVANGVGHIPIASNGFCMNCHPAEGERTAALLPIATVHEGVARAIEAGLYRGSNNGFSIDTASYDRNAQEITVDYSVTRGAQKMDLQTDPRWNNGASLSFQVAWSTEEYTNEGGESSPAPAQPRSFSALDVGGEVTDLGSGNYRRTMDVSSFGFGNLTVGLQGHPQADLFGNGTFVRMPVRDVFETVNVELREDVVQRRHVIDIAKCNSCHDSAGAGLSFHGDNRTSEDQVCVLCHTADATDIRQRPADPATTPDGKREESIDFKRMIHGIHSGEDLQNGLVVYGFGGNSHDYSGVGFIGNSQNCLTCHLPGTYSTQAAALTVASTIDTGADVTDHTDDLNISPITATCSSCHDDLAARNHMLLGGGSFQAPDESIVVPEPGVGLSLLAGFGVLGALARRRERLASEGAAGS